MALSTAEWIAMSLGGHRVLSSDPSPRLLGEVGWDLLIGALDAEARAAGLTDLQLSVLIHLAARAVVTRPEWGGTQHEDTAVRMSEARTREYFEVEPERVREAERVLAAKGWLAFEPRGGGGEGVLDLGPLLSRWEALCCLVQATLEVSSAAERLRCGIAWRAAGLGRECDLCEVPELSEFATLAELTAECERLLLALAALPGAPAGAVTGWLPANAEPIATTRGLDGAPVHSPGRQTGQVPRTESYWLTPELAEAVEKVAGVQELTPSEWVAGVLALRADADTAMSRRGYAKGRDEFELPRGRRPGWRPTGLRRIWRRRLRRWRQCRS